MTDARDEAPVGRSDDPGTSYDPGQTGDAQTGDAAPQMDQTGDAAPAVEDLTGSGDTGEDGTGTDATPPDNSLGVPPGP